VQVQPDVSERRRAGHSIAHSTAWFVQGKGEGNLASNYALVGRRMAGSSRPRIIVSQRCGRMGDGPSDLRLDEREFLAKLAFSCAVLGQTISHYA
jgi:hypothetical protein